MRFRSQRKGEADSEERFKTYWDFDAALSQVKPYQFLAIQRGESAKCLSVHFLVAEEDSKSLLEALVARFLGPQVAAAASPLRCSARGNAYRSEIMAAMQDGYKRLLLPSGLPKALPKAVGA